MRLGLRHAAAVRFSAAILAHKPLHKYVKIFKEIRSAILRLLANASYLPQRYQTYPELFMAVSMHQRTPQNRASVHIICQPRPKFVCMAAMGSGGVLSGYGLLRVSPS